VSIVDKQIAQLKILPAQISSKTLGKIVDKTQGALAAERCRNIGFPFIKRPGSRPFYDRDAVIAFLDQNRPTTISVSRARDRAGAL
jgi:hypothetical protein